MDTVTIKMNLLPVSTNKSHENGTNGQRILTADTKSFREQVMDHVYQKRLQMIKGEVEYFAVFAFGRTKNDKPCDGDCSNRIKQMEDALNGLIWEDDKYVMKGTYTRDMKSKRPYFKVTIKKSKQKYV
jgi:Holliday junction resolvase RusA-like endonuclease